MQRFSIGLGAFLFILLANIYSQDYIWPTDASEILTSSFAESRSGRFHAGIDVKTWGRTGYNIYAIRDGYISRIRVSPFGYGRALYLTLDTGEIVVYGHLEKFRDDIEAYVKQQQRARGNYEIQLYPKSTQFLVQQGDVLGLTGDSGVGYPHLHFEMRDAGSNPINPMNRGYKVFDDIAPAVTKILIQPLDALSLVNNDYRPQVFWPAYQGNGVYKLPHPVSVSGRIAIGVSSYDQMNGADHKFGTYQNELYINDRLVFQSQYDRFSYYENNQFDLDRDFRQRSWGRGYFYNLFRDFGNNLPFYAQSDLYYGVVDIKNGFSLFKNSLLAEDVVEIPPGVLPIEGERHTFKIVLKDYWGNTSTVYGTLVVNGKDMVLMEEDSSAKDTMASFYLDVFDPQPDDSTEVFFDIEPQFYDRHVRISIKPRQPLQHAPTVSGWLCSGASYQMPLIQKNWNTFIGAWPLSGCVQGPLPLKITGMNQKGDTLVQNSWIHFTTVPRGQTKRVRSDDGVCKLDFSTNSLFKDIFVRISALEAPNDDYERVLPFYKLEPSDVPLDKGATISFAFPKGDSLPAKLGIYAKFGDRLRFMGNKLNMYEGRISAHTSYLGTFTLVRDTKPPRVMYLSPANNSRFSNTTPTLRASFKDDLSGLGGESSREMRLNGKKVIAEYDPESLVLEYEPEEPLPSGKHTVELFLMDRSGNSTLVTHEFFIN